MKSENCKYCGYLEYHDEVINGIEYKGYYCGDFYNLTENANIENIDECEWAD